MANQRTVTQVIIFLMIISSIFLVASFYVAGFFKLALTGSAVDLWKTAGIIWVGSLTYLLGEFVSRVFGFMGLKHLGAIFLGYLSIAFAVSTVGYIALLIHIPGPVTATVGVLSIVIMGIWGLVNALRTPIVTSLSPVNPNASALGLTIVHITDLHLDGITSTQWVKKLVTKINGLNPDIVVFTGDLLDIHPDKITDQIALLKQITATKAKLAVSGNHDFYMQYPTFQAVLESINFTLIDNQHHHVEGIDFVGISDRDGDRFGHTRSDISDLFLKFPPSQRVIALSHRPDEFHHFADNGVLLQLSGHTHWGQIPPFGFIIRLWYTHGRGHGKRGGSHIYVSKGTGVWGPPMRLFGRSEIVVVTA